MLVLETALAHEHDATDGRAGHAHPLTLLRLPGYRAGMAEPPELIIFDLDGTLVDSRRDLADALNHARVGFGLPPLDVETVSAFVGDGVRILIERAFATTDPNVVEAALAAFRPYYGAHCLDHTRLYPDVRETLATLPVRALAVLTNKPEAFARTILEGLEVGSRFVAVIGGDSGPMRKPDPAGVHEILRRTGVAPARAVLVGDSTIDLGAARAAGVRAGLVGWGFGREADLRAARPDFFLRRFADLPAALGLAGPRS